MARQYIWLRDREFNNQFSRWLYNSIINSYESIDEFSYKNGICKSNIYSWIYGDYNPGRKNLRRLSKIFYVRVDDLLQIM